jgi:putative transposase
MIKALKVRLYPTEEQMVLLEKHFGANRFIWNHFLEARTKYYAESKSRGKAQGLNYFQTCKMLTEMKKEKEWLYEISSPTLQQTLRKLDNAFTSFFRKNTDYPKFRSKKDNQYFVVPQNGKIVGNRIVIPKFLEGIIFRDKFDFSKIKEIDQIVVTKDVERYYASIFYESDEIPEKAEAVVGIDVGVRHFITMSDGIQVEPLNAYRKMEKKLKREQRRLSRKKKGSKNRRKQIVKLERLHQKIRDSRTDFNHKVSSAIAKHYGIVVVEDLNIQGMERNRHLSGSIVDQGWYQFLSMLKYKMDWREAELIEIGRFEPSSKLCSGCGNIKHGLKLSDRTYCCDVCGLEIDRDLNAAINICNIGLIKVGKGIPEFTPVESATAAELSKGGLRVATL